MSADIPSTSETANNRPNEGPSTGSSPSPGNPGRTIAVMVFVAVAAVIAMGGGTSIPINQTGVSADVAASLSVTSSELAQAAHQKDGVHGATGGYVPGVGIVITTEIDEIEASDISDWTRSLISDVANIGQLPEGEEVIFLLDVARPSRTSRLVSLNPAELNEAGQMMGRQAPATSTTPLVAQFEAAPGALASVDEESESGDAQE